MRIGVDFGGTKIEAAALGDDGAFLARIRDPNPGTYDAALQTVRGLIERVEAETGRSGTVGVGAPGSVSPSTALMRNANSTWLNGRRFREDLTEVLGREIRLANDADCLALSEARDGAAKNAKVVFAVILGTGCGGGLVVNGELVTGFNGIAGEWGHISLPWAKADETPGPACWCGLNGCLETWISGSGFQRDHAEVTGQTLTAEAIVTASRAGDSAAMASLDRYIDRLGRGLAMVCNFIDPEVIVIGGGMSNVDELYPNLHAVIARHVFADDWGGTVVAPWWWDSSGVRGAARLWPLNSGA